MHTEARGNLKMNFDKSAARTLANMLRVMRGCGHGMRIVPDIESIASALGEFGDDNDARTVAANDIVRGVQSWRDTYINRECLSGSIGALENGVCDAALRLIAANLDGNSTEASKATRDLFGVLTAREALSRERDRLEFAEIASDIANDNANIRTDSAAVKRLPTKANGKAECLVYFIGDGNGCIKIGKSTSPSRRLASLQTAHPRRLELIATMPGGAYMEGRLHEKFADHRLSGEWFKDCAEIRGYLAANDNTPRSIAA